MRLLVGHTACGIPFRCTTNRTGKPTGKERFTASVVGGMSAGRAAECPTAGTFDTFESNHQFPQHTAAGVTDIDTEG